jgi:oxygen-independent coproporphyrinogen-3 oxidase
LNKLGLYIHIPFCKSKCPYCSFISFKEKEESFDPYLVALQKEAIYFKGREVSTVYIGGGTPTVLDKKRLEFLFSIIHVNFSLSPEAEVTIEANPATFDLAKAEILRDYGVNRVSLGIQSFNNKYLEFLKRPYNRIQALEAVDILKQANFKNINLDLMYGLPGQDACEIEEDVKTLLSLSCSHASLYALSIEAGSEFYKNNFRLLSSDLQASYFELVKDMLIHEGFCHYEVSNFSLNNFECRHNLNYWRGGTYLGLGVAAHSYMEGRRLWNTERLDVYMNLLCQGFPAQAGEEHLDPLGQLMESFLIGLRLTEGVDLKKLEVIHQVKLPEEKERRIFEFIRGGFLQNENSCFKATVKGMMILDELCSRLI